MRKLSLIFSALLLSVLVACGDSTKESKNDSIDQEACDLYETTVESADDGTITDDEMLADLDETYHLAQSEELQDLLDDLLIYFEEGDGNLQIIVDDIEASCSLD